MVDVERPFRSQSDVRAMVLTYRRPREATRTVRHLVEVEGFEPRDVLLVVNAEGGLDDESLASEVELLVLQENSGPAGGFRAGLEHLSALDGVAWVYVCEDDAGELSLPAPRVTALRELADEWIESGHRPGAIVAYGRRLDRRTGLTIPHDPDPHGPRLQPTDVAAWGSTLISVDALRRGVLPDPAWFFGYEDFDFFLRLRATGYEVLLDRDSALDVRCERLHGHGSVGEVAAWRSYYAARNFLELRRRHGHLGWTVVHVLKSVRRAQLSRSRATRRSIARGLVDGFRRRLGRDPSGAGP